MTRRPQRPSWQQLVTTLLRAIIKRAEAWGMLSIRAMLGIGSLLARCSREFTARHSLTQTCTTDLAQGAARRTLVAT